jgi:Histidine kinase-, DNA gyrase B-, and HSP90-like ATPase
LGARAGRRIVTTAPRSPATDTGAGGPHGQGLRGLLRSLATTELERLRQEKAILERVDLVEVTRRAAADYLRDPTRRVSLEPPEEPLEISVDPLRLSQMQILMNLLSNAHKYSQPDTPIRLRLWREGGWAKVAVIDQGHGIPGEELERIFDKFHRVEDPMTMAATAPGSACTSLASWPAPWAARWTPPAPPAALRSPCAFPWPARPPTRRARSAAQASSVRAASRAWRPAVWMTAGSM